MTEARNRWPCLRRIKGRSMNAVVPRIIIGSPHRHLTIPREILCSSLGGPVATRTILGWVLEGNLKGNGNGTMYYLNASASELDLTLHNLMKESFKNEDFGIKPLPSRHSLEEKKALQIMESTTIKIDDRWQTGLLWRCEDIKLPDSYSEALNRLCATERRMERDKLFHAAYMNKIDEYRDKGFIRKLSVGEASSENERTFYIPHFGVTNPNKPGKFRLVFDAAAKSKGVSLNDCLLTGPDLLRSLTSVLWNFRRHRIVISGDIEDMFHRVIIQEKDRCSQRFLWRDGDSSKAPDIYEMLVMIFGATSSPSSAIFVKNKNAQQYLTEYPDACRAIQDDFYVDDCLTGADKDEEASKLREDITYVNQQGGFHIKKWISNSKSVMDTIPVELRLHGGRVFTGISTAREAEERVLGLWWDPEGDFFTFKTNFHKVDPEILKGKLPTKRQICSLVMSLYDPLGFIGHYRVKGMIILQHVWNSGIGWDDEVPEEIFEEWLIWVGEINLITQVNIPRCYCVDSKNAVDVELHTFTDASKEAYAAVCYFRFIFVDHVNVSFVSSKVKVAPLKKLTVPRLELQAAVLGSKLANTIASEIKLKITRRFFWSDSRTVLSWIRSESARQPEFVGNRIGYIQDTTNSCEWRWVPTLENVADDATRIAKETDFSPDSRWYTGPSFLTRDSCDWPSPKADDDETLVEAVTFSDVLGVRASSEGSGLRTGEDDMVIKLINKFSSYTRLLRVVVAVLRVSRRWLALTKMKNGVPDPPNKLIPLYIEENGIKMCTATAEELAEAENFLIKEVQRHVFLCKGALHNDKKMRQLSPYFDEDGILRARGRIDNSKVSIDIRRPIILPSQHRLTDLIVDCEHRRNAHTGQDTVLNNLRKKFWIIDGRQVIRRCWSRCDHCRLQRAKPIIPEMGVLPACRLDSGKPPFTYTGIDYFGPIEVTVGRRHEKRWGVLLCCMVTRAIHLEVAHALSTDETLLALSRFVDAKRRPHTIFSDNGTNFHGAIKELERAVSTENYKKIMEETGMEKIRWSFIPPAAAHMGGAWERLIQAVKKVLKNALHEKYPRDTVLLTAMKAAENIVNSRPMTYLSADAEDPGALTPNHFIKGEVDVGPSIPSEVENRASYFRQKWKEAQALANGIWERWTKEYLPTLLRREKWTDQVEPIDVGDIVLIVDDQLPRNCWVKAVVTATFPGKDGHVRAVEVTTRNFETKKKTTLKRPVTKLCPLGLKIGKSALMTANLGAGNVGK
ncbi:unnamed protein product [Orchesella dallaii]|uniref:Integrase catalytic domain-containing protein n=1 Tax=Orchesella dallaii TaxID=48710 RepID=A0ABP1RH73_9HEXA